MIHLIHAWNCITKFKLIAPVAQGPWICLHTERLWVRISVCALVILSLTLTGVPCSPTHPTQVMNYALHTNKWEVGINILLIPQKMAAFVYIPKLTVIFTSVGFCMPSNNESDCHHVAFPLLCKSVIYSGGCFNPGVLASHHVHCDLRASEQYLVRFPTPHVFDAGTSLLYAAFLKGGIHILASPSES